MPQAGPRKAISVSPVIYENVSCDVGERQAGAVAPNVLDRTFEAAAPNRKWIADFTYVWTAEGCLFVAASLICSPGVWLAGR